MLTEYFCSKASLSGENFISWEYREEREIYIYIQGFDGKLERGKWNREAKKLRWRKNYDSWEGRGVFICHGNAFTTDSFQFGKLSRPRFSTVFVRKYKALENLGRGIKPTMVILLSSRLSFVLPSQTNPWQKNSIALSNTYIYMYIYFPSNIIYYELRMLIQQSKDSKMNKNKQST